MRRTPYTLGIAYIGLCAFAIGTRDVGIEDHFVRIHHEEPPAPAATTGANWFAAVKPSCNSVEVEMTVRAHPAPKGVDGAGYEAGCLALAGKIERAREAINRLPAAVRWQAAGIVFDLAHQVADAGDDASAGPIMAMVVDFWPNHPMALYHAGMAEAALGSRAAARDHLTAFLRYYPARDGWRANARTVLRKLRR